MFSRSFSCMHKRYQGKTYYVVRTNGGFYKEMLALFFFFCMNSTSTFWSN